MKKDGRTISECRTLSGTMARPGVVFASVAGLFYMIPLLLWSRLLGIISVLFMAEVSHTTCCDGC